MNGLLMIYHRGDSAEIDKNGMCEFGYQVLGASKIYFIKTSCRWGVGGGGCSIFSEHNNNLKWAILGT
jgi:hypothetical protein